MTLSFFSKHKTESSKRYNAVNCVRMWLAGRSHLPKDLMAALRYLIPELAEESSEAAELTEDDLDNADRMI